MIRDIISESIADDCCQVGLSTEMDEAIRALRSWLFENVYQAESVQSEFNKASHLLHELFHYFCDKQDIFMRYGGRRFTGDSLEVSVADFIAGMTDRFALSLYRECFLPQPWKSI
jgi:dGTPase